MIIVLGNKVKVCFVLYLRNHHMDQKVLVRVKVTFNCFIYKSKQALAELGQTQVKLDVTGEVLVDVRS